MINAFGTNPAIATQYEAQIAIRMHAKLGLRGKIPNDAPPKNGATREQHKVARDRRDRIYALLEEHHHTAAELSEIIGSDRKTVSNDLRWLRERGHVVALQKRGNEWKWGVK